MPDGSQQPTDPAAQRAQEQMRDWKEQHRDGDGGGWIGNVVNTIGDMMAAAEAGQFAVSPDTGAAIIKQLDDVKDQVNQMKTAGGSVMLSQRLGGGYATNIANFNLKVTDEGLGTTLTKFAEELDQLKSVVSRSIANYVDTDGAASGQVNQAGGGL